MTTDRNSEHGRFFLFPSLPAWVRQLGRWGLPFLALLLAFWLVTHRPNAPQLILLFLLYIITINFSLPPRRGSIGLTPVVATTSLLVVGLEAALSLALVSFAVAELARPLWNPMWDAANAARPSGTERLGNAATILLALLAARLSYRQLGGALPLTPDAQENLVAFAGLALAYGLTDLLLSLSLWIGAGRSWRGFLLDHALPLLSASLLAQPFALFGGIIIIAVGLPAFVIFSGGVMLFSIIIWLSWQRRAIAEQQLHQFMALNEISLSLRETLELSDVLERTCRQLAELIPADRYAITLLDEDGKWRRPYQWPPAPSDEPSPSPDDFTRRVVEYDKRLNLHRRNMHFAERHNLTPPHPQPAAWLGAPLPGNDQPIGAITVQREDGPAFSRWDEQLLRAISSQAGAAIQNARLYGETVRLYTLTDAALARRLEQLQALLNSVQEGVVMVDTAGHIVLVNPVAARLLGAPPGQLRGERLATETAVSHLGYTAEAWKTHLAHLQEQRPPSPGSYQYELETAGENRAVIERHGAPVLAEEGRVMGWLMTLRDVTEEQELARRRADLIRMIVHDLRNPVTTLLSTLRAMEKRLPAGAGEELSGLLRDAQQGSSDLLDMIDSLMDINRMEAGQTTVDAEAMRLPPLVEQVVGRLQPLAAQRQITLAVNGEDDLPAVWGDREILRRVLLNLLDNGLKFTPAGGSITLTLAAETAVPIEYQSGVRCTISDTGPGIPPEFREQIFDRFMRTNRGGAQVRGTGLGLTFCRLAVEAHDGRIWNEDNPGGGSRFVFTIPGIPTFEL